MNRKWMITAFCAMAALLLTGCSMTVEDMYTLPKRSAQYSQLQSAIDSAMVGLRYSAPISGENQQSVQMADLDGDGVEEYLIFASGNREKPLQILIFTQEEDGTCLLTEVIASNGTAFEQVEYVDFDGRPGCELIVGRQVSDQVLRSVSVYTFADGSAEQQLAVGYSKFLTCDLDADGSSELMVLRPGEAETERGMAVLYRMVDGQISRSVETEMSEPPEQIRRIMVGKLQGGIPAVYVASGSQTNSIVTDVFALKDEKFVNIAFSNESHTTVQTLWNFYVYAEDIDEDGIVELPCLVPMQGTENWPEEEKIYLLRWFSMDLNGKETDKLYTFHNYPGGWYIHLDEAWAERVIVTQEAETYTFHVWDEDSQGTTALFTVFVFTGGTRDEDAVREGRFALYRTEGIAYAARLELGASEYGITEENMTQRFHLIRQDWRTGDT